MARKDQDWSNLYEYVKKEILDYDKSMKLPRYMVLRLKGLNRGQFIANNKHEKFAEYPFNTILLTFKIHKNLIKTSSSKIENEQHKFNYIMSIIENKINDVMLRLEKSKNAEEKAKKIDINTSTDGAKYKPKTNKKENERLKELW